MTISQSQPEGGIKLATPFDRQAFIDEGQQVKIDAVLSVIATQGVNMLPETFNSLVTEAFLVNNYVVRAQLLESVSADLKSGRLTEENIDKTIAYLARRLDSSATRLGNMLELIEECKTPGTRH